jgi:hypothetical protein
MPAVSLATKHDKARLIAPYLAPLGFEVISTDLFDTDLLGTFSGEIERSFSPHAAALKKAQTACELSGMDWGLGSEGSFGGGPMPGLMNWNEEILCLYQASTTCAIYALASGPTHLDWFSSDELPDIAQRLEQFVGQHWILRVDNCIEKGLTASEILRRLSLQKSPNKHFKIEPDLRAMYCPQRQQMITQAAQDLARRISALCPQCQAMNFVVKQKLAGLPCELCSLPTQVTKTLVSVCDQCAYQQEECVNQKQANASYCSFCNP